MRGNVPIAVDPLKELGDPEIVFKAPAVLQFMRVLIDIIRRQFSRFLDRDVAAPHFHLVSPNGTAFIVTVTDEGVLQIDNARAKKIAATP